MQPVNEALMTDEEFLLHIEKKIEPQLANCGNVELRAATIGRLCTMIRARDEVMHAQIQNSRTTFSRILDAAGTTRLTTIDPYLNLRKEFSRKEDGTHDLTLSIVNIPHGPKDVPWEMGDPKNKIYFKASREKLIEEMDKIVKRGVVGETDQESVRWRVRQLDLCSRAQLDEYARIDPMKVAGKLLSYEISGIRDGSGSQVITGNVKLTDTAAAMIESGNYIFGIRSSVSMDGSDRVIDAIHGFDMFPVHELNIAI